MARKGCVRAFLGLNWFSLPSRVLPHGLCGAIGLLSGAVLIFGSVVGSYTFIRSWIFQLFLTSSAASAIAGFLMAGRAAKEFHQIFRFAACFQLCLIYHSWRFFEYRAPPSTTLDWLASLMTLIIIGAFAIKGMIILTEMPAASASIFVGCLALLLLAGYPLQVAAGGEEWWTCVQEKYPMQALGMVAYIYVPTTWTFSAMMFGATLLSRKIIGNVAFGLGFAGLIMLTLVGTVLMQEVHMPIVSTQRLYLPCPEPEAGSWRAWLVDALDTSVLAQSALRFIRRLMAP